MKIEFLFDPNAEQVTWNDLDTISLIRRKDLQEVDTLRLHDLVCKFMVDDNGQYVPPDEAFKVLGKLTKSQITETLEKFMKAVQDVAIPKVNGSKLNAPTEAQSADLPSLGG